MGVKYVPFKTVTPLLFIENEECVSCKKTKTNTSTSKFEIYIPNHISSQGNQIYYEAMYRSRSTKTLPSIQTMLNSVQNSRFSSIFTILLVHKTTPAISTKGLFHYFSQFSATYITLTCSQNHSYNLKTPFL